MNGAGMISKFWPGAKARSRSKGDVEAAKRTSRKETTAKDVEVAQYVEKGLQQKDEIKGVCPRPHKN